MLAVSLWRWGSPLLFLLVSLGPSPSWAQDGTLDEVWNLVEEHFFDASFNGVAWAAQRARSAEPFANATSPDERASIINDMLALLETSHTRYYTRDDPAYYTLLDIFQAVPRVESLLSFFPDSVVAYTGIGLRTAMINDTLFALEVYEGGPAHTAGVLMGDAILAVDGAPYHPIRSFAGKADQAVPMMIQRTPDPASQQTLTVTPTRLRPQALFLEALDQSIRIEERGGRRIGYVHVWSYAGRVFQDALEAAVAFGPLKDADALILDIRGGWGGASPTYLNLFNPNVPVFTQRQRDGMTNTFDFQWRKPVALLVNEGSRSGKEVLAWGFKAYNLGLVIGTPTAGAVVGGQIFPLADGSLLYLATRDVLVNGERLEGVGVTPDILVPFYLPYAAGRDPQLERALDVLSQL